MTTFAPRPASAKQISRPIRSALPVTSAVRSRSSTCHLVYGRECLILHYGQCTGKVACSHTPFRRRTVPDDVHCALVSGGLDSAVMLSRMLDDGASIQPVYVQTGTAWESVEFRWLERFLKALDSPRLRPVHVLRFPMSDVYGAHWSMRGADVPSADTPDEAVYLPGRNVILVAKTAVYCALNGMHRIALGVLAGNPFPDATDSFF